MTNIMQSEEKRRHSSSNQYTKIPLPIQPLKNVEHVRCVECGNDKRDLLLYNSLSTSWQNSVSTLPISLIGRSRSSSHLGYSGYRGNKQIPGALHRHNREIVLNRSQNKLITKELVSQNHSAPEKGAIKQRPSVFQNSTTGKDYGMVVSVNRLIDLDFYYTILIFLWSIIISLVEYIPNVFYNILIEFDVFPILRHH